MFLTILCSIVLFCTIVVGIVFEDESWGKGFLISAGIVFACYSGILIGQGQIADNRYQVSYDIVSVTKDNMRKAEYDEINDTDIKAIYWMNRKNGIEDVDTFINFTHMEKEEAEKILEKLH